MSKVYQSIFLKNRNRIVPLLSLSVSVFVLVITLSGCGEKNDNNNNNNQTVTLSDKWHGVYHSTSGDNEVVLTVTSEGGVLEIDGSTTALTVRAEHKHEIQLINTEQNVYHLTYLGDNPTEQRYDLAITEKDNPSKVIMASVFMQREGDSIEPASTSGETSDSISNETGDSTSSDINDDNGISKSVADDWGKIGNNNTEEADVEETDEEQDIMSEGFPFIDVLYTNDFNETLIFQKPDEKGYPTEIKLKGVTYTIGEYETDYSCLYLSDSNQWSISAGGRSSQGDIGFSALGNDQEWRFWISGAMNEVTDFYRE